MGDSNKNPSLRDRYLVPPFSVFDARMGYWQERKRAWLALGIESEQGRGGSPTKKATGGLLMRSHSSIPSYYQKKTTVEKRLGRTLSNEEFSRDYYEPPKGGVGSGNSIFDPVLTEVAYAWFCPPGGVVLDPFAGGSVRGVVASVLGRRYVGVDLSEIQVEANRRQGRSICRAPHPVWLPGDSVEIETLCAGTKADFLFSCPPYFDLERYSKNPGDLSNMKQAAFVRRYGEIIGRSCALLKEDRFACFVVGDVREKKTGFYRKLVPHTIEAFESAGLRFYNEAILATVAGSLPIRARRPFEQSRKLGRTHQAALIFVKGDPRAAARACGSVVIEPLPFKNVRRSRKRKAA